MKKTLLTILFALLCTSAWAQHFTLWYGGGYNGLTNSLGGSNHEFRMLNFGLDYSNHINNKLDWTAGLGYHSCEMNYNPLQVEGNASYKLSQSPSFGFSVLTGPYLAWNVNKSKVYKTFFYGWQAGVKFDFSRVSLKAGYEYALNSIDMTNRHHYQLFARVGYSF